MTEDTMKNQGRISARLGQDVYTQLESLRELGKYKTISDVLRDVIGFAYAKRTGTLEKDGERGIRRSIVYSLRDDKFLHELVDKYNLAVDIPDAIRVCVREYMCALEEGMITIPGSTLENLVGRNKDLEKRLSAEKMKAAIDRATVSAALYLAKKPPFAVSVISLGDIDLVLGAPEEVCIEGVTMEILPEPQQESKYVVLKETENATVWVKQG